MTSPGQSPKQKHLAKIIATVTGGIAIVVASALGQFGTQIPEFFEAVLSKDDSIKIACPSPINTDQVTKQKDLFPYIANTNLPEQKSLKFKINQIRIRGSTSLLDISHNLAIQFMATYSPMGLRSYSTGGGTSVGLEALKKGNAEIAAVSDLSPDIRNANPNWRPVEIGKDAIVLVVGKENRFRNPDGLTSKQVKEIYQSKIPNWPDSQVAIRPINRNEKSGTRKAFQRLALNDEDFSSDIKDWSQDETTPVLGELKKDGIYYATCHQVIYQKTVRILPIDGRSPDDPSYPYSRRLYYMYEVDEDQKTQDEDDNKPRHDEVKVFLGYVFSEEGQEIIENRLSIQEK